MKLLFDQNLSHRIVPTFADAFPTSAHVRDFDLQRAGDLDDRRRRRVVRFRLNSEGLRGRMTN